MKRYEKPMISKNNKISTNLLSGSCYTNIDPVYPSPCVEPVKHSNYPHDFYEFLEWLFGWLFK